MWALMGNLPLGQGMRMCGGSYDTLPLGQGTERVWALMSILPSGQEGPEIFSYPYP
ncbi:hypothetical protein J27TS7_37940 [Paenibacillus dendritiformis]|nr:hypothetical protein J27TS7_37940 [Paenibacillus dendritiformis]